MPSSRSGGSAFSEPAYITRNIISMQQRVYGHTTGAKPNQIAVLCGYKAQLRCLRTLASTAGVTLATYFSRFMEQQQLSDTLRGSRNLVSGTNINYMEILEKDWVDQNGESQAVLIYFDISRYRESRLVVSFIATSRTSTSSVS